MMFQNLLKWNAFFNGIDVSSADVLLLTLEIFYSWIAQFVLNGIWCLDPLDNLEKLSINK